MGSRAVIGVVFLSELCGPAPTLATCVPDTSASELEEIGPWVGPSQEATWRAELDPEDGRLWAFDPRTEHFYLLEGFGMQPQVGSFYVCVFRSGDAYVEDCYREVSPLRWVLADRVVVETIPECGLPRGSHVRSTYEWDGHALQRTCSRAELEDGEVISAWGEDCFCPRIR